MAKDKVLTLESKVTTVVVSSSEDAKDAINKAIDEHVAELSRHRLEIVGPVVADAQPSLIIADEMDIIVRALVRKIPPKPRTKIKGAKNSA